jgi:PhoPQ-activated pathogenicity-related protein
VASSLIRARIGVRTHRQLSLPFKRPMAYRKSKTGQRFALARLIQLNPGDDLLSHAATRAVPSALEGLTSVFGMGTGVAPPV